MICQSQLLTRLTPASRCLTSSHPCLYHDTRQGCVATKCKFGPITNIFGFRICNKYLIPNIFGFWYHLKIINLIARIIRDNTDTRSQNKLQLRPKNQPHLNVLKRTCFHPGVSGISITDIFLHPHLHLNVNFIRNGERLCWSSTSQTGDRDGHDEGDMEHGTK